MSDVLYGAPRRELYRQTVLFPSRDTYLQTVDAAKADGFDMCADVCGVDYLTHAGKRELPEGIVAERFEVVAVLVSLESRRRIRLRVQVPESDPVVPTLFDRYLGSEAMERETYDMMGIVFDGHPDLTRILMPEDWEGHPLRKDFAIGRVPVQFKSPSATR